MPPERQTARVSPHDGGCLRCGCVPRGPSGLCASCLDEDAERAGEIPPTPAVEAALAEGKSWSSTLAAEVVRLRAEVAHWKAQAFQPLGDNHHNALLCPHCNPEGRRFV